MSPARLGLVLLVACAAAVVAIPAADEDSFRETLAAFREAKSKDDRVAALKGKDDAYLKGFTRHLLSEHSAFRGRGEFAEAGRVLLWAEETAAAVTGAEARASCELTCAMIRGYFEQSQERYDAAVHLYKKVLAAARKQRAHHIIVGVNLSLAAVQKEQGDYLGGLATVEDGLAAVPELPAGERAGPEAVFRITRGQLFMELGDFIAAEGALKEAQQIAKKHRLDFVTSALRQDFASLDARRGRYGDAIAVWEGALEENRRAGNKPAQVDILLSLGTALAEYGRKGDAFRRSEDARKLAAELKLPRSEAAAHYRLAAQYAQVGAEEDAARHLRDALALYKASGDQVGVARCLSVAAVLHVLAGRPVDAERVIAEALAITKTGGSASRTAELNLLMGWQFYKTGALKKAEEYLAVAINDFEKIGETSQRALARELRILCLIGTGDERYRNELLALDLDVAKFKNPRAELSLHYCIANIDVARKDWPAAIKRTETAIQKAKAFHTQIEDPRLEVTRRSRSVLTELYVLRAAAHAGNGDSAAAFVAADRAKGSVLNRLLERSRSPIQKGMTSDEQQEEGRLRNAVSAAVGTAAAQMRFANAEPGKREALITEQLEAEARYEEFKTKMALAHPGLLKTRGELPDIDLTELQKTVFAREPDLAVLSYLVLPDRVLIAVVSAGDEPDGPARVAIRSVEVNAEELADAADQFWKACQASKAGRPVSDDLYRWLIEPAERDTAGKKHLLVVPCHPLLALPFQALAPSKDDPYLIERFAVSYAPSVSALMEMRRRGDEVRGPGPADRLPVLAVGGAKFTPDLPDLPASGPEAEAVGKVFGDRARVLLAGDATRAEISKAMPAARFLHFATHGEVNAPRPLFSALGVTPANKGDDGRLYAHDVMNLDLNAELVVLSACDTGRGRDYRGEGTVGLAWAFFVAGTPAVVVSQWKVGDAATADLMRAFYTRMHAGGGGSKAEALRQAALELMKDKKTRHPRFWAPFQLTGDWRN